MDQNAGCGFAVMFPQGKVKKLRRRTSCDVMRQFGLKREHEKNPPARFLRISFAQPDGVLRIAMF
jgi:hypothetical protein